MEDRNPTPGQEGRMLITPEDGTPAFHARVEMADNPRREGTPLNKATLLKDATAALFGLDNTAVPDDVLAAIPALIDGRAKIVTGSYTGTGTYGSDNKNSLTFEFVPKLVVILPEGTYSPNVLLLVNGLTRTGILEKSSSYWALTVSWSDNTVSWYAPNGTDGGEEQMNKSGITYRYCAIG